MSNALRHALTSFKEQLERRQQDRRTDRIAKSRAEQNMEATPNASMATSPDVRAFFARIASAVNADRDRYTLDPTNPAAPLVPPVEDHDVAAMAHASVAPSVHMQFLWESWQRSATLIPSLAESSLPQNPCAALLVNELNYLMQENGQRPMMAASVLMKVKQSVQAFMDGRFNDTVTLLKNALHTDPHNHSILAILSQILYYQATRGVQNSLPEARDFAQRSTIFSEKHKPSQLGFYRYLAIVTERSFGPERAMELLRETDMLSIAPFLKNPDGLMAERGLYLRAWYLLSGIPVDLWQETEMNTIKELVTKVIGGSVIYMMWLRGPLLAAAALSKSPMPVVEEVERLLQAAHRSFAEHATALKQLPLTASDKPWLLRVRFLNAVVQVTPVPYFDQAMSQIALDGQSWNEGVSPDPELRAAIGLREISYWRLWSLVLTPFKDIKQPYLMPAEETVSDGDLLASCDQLLNTLISAEKQLIKAHLWEDLKPWLVRWQLDHLLAASTGSNKPRMRFAPSLAPYTSLYRIWQEPPVSGLLPSEIITENAKRGAFSSLFEVVAALDGANRFIGDPVHGLVASQKTALAAANRYNPKKFKTVAAEFGGSAGSSLLILALPVAGLGLVAAIFTFSANWQQAMGLTAALAGVVGFVWINLKK